LLYRQQTTALAAGQQRNRIASNKQRIPPIAHHTMNKTYFTIKYKSLLLLFAPNSVVTSRKKPATEHKEYLLT